MVVVIPYRNEPHKGLELQYALRSIEKNLTRYDRVIIIGDKPSWLKNVEHIEFGDEAGRKELSIRNKLLKACEITEEFIYWNDDHFLLQPLHVKDFKFWFEGTLKELKEKSRSGYQTTVSNTLKYLPNGLNFDIHAPIVFNSKVFQIISRQYDWTNELLIKSTYCNHFANGSEYMTDLKLNAPYTYERIKEKIKDRLFFSIGNYAVDENMCKVWDELYPDRSKYE